MCVIFRKFRLISREIAAAGITRRIKYAVRIHSRTDHASVLRRATNGRVGGAGLRRRAGADRAPPGSSSQFLVIAAHQFGA